MTYDFHASNAQRSLPTLERLLDADSERSLEREGQLDAFNLLFRQMKDSDPAVVEWLAKAVGKKKLAGYWNRNWREQQKRATTKFTREFGKLCGAAEAVPSPHRFPPGSWTITLQFTLRRPLITKDDVAFYPTENAIRKDRALGLPYFAASSWKGCLRNAFRIEHKGTDASSRNVFNDEKQAEDAEGRLFGNLKEAEKDHHRGRLVFFPSWFHRIGFHVINPQNRTKAKGEVPVFYEVVPEGATSHFTLLYCPFATSPDSDVPSESMLDLRAIAEPLRGMLTVLGFGGKTSSGFGTAAEDVVDGRVRWSDEVERFQFLTKSGDNSLSAAVGKLTKRISTEGSE